ncbi:hypothetical protein ACFVIM_20930 [Streptomyces sp. NPDC057638]|uniref:imidazolonepropionase-like domain-containing protein n=1 Tax=Streptomyces sp. NPDC057638 TaxID=3346190 RepID=UPI0036CFD07F
MLTLHTADQLLGHPGGSGRQAVAVDGATVVALGPYEEVSAAFPGARTRNWRGLLTPGLRHLRAAELLERAYHPDPREAGDLGTEPLTGDELAVFAPSGLDDTRWGQSARRGLQRLLGQGVTAVAGPFRRAPVLTAVARGGLRVLPAASAGAVPEGVGVTLDPLAGRALADVVGPALVVGAVADLAVFDVPDAAALAERGTRSCVATVLGGRLVYRRA